MFRLLIRGVGVGYVSMAVSMAYSFLSIPMALKYLGKTEYGLWALVLSITSYLNFSELGMTNSVQRHLIDLKEKRPNREFGAIFLTGAVVFLVIGVACLVVGGLAIPLVTPLFRVPETFLATFEWLLLGAVALFGLSIGSRILGVPLYVYQRHDLYELSNIFLYLIWLIVLWIGFRLGLGVYSLLLSQGVGFLWTCGFNITACLRLSLYPARAEWGRPSRKLLSEIAVYARDSFLQQLGQQFVNTLPLLLISRWMGLDAAAIWTVATRPFFILRQILGRPFQYGVSMLADLLANRGQEAMLVRWMQLSQIMTAGALALYPVCAAYNADFLALWTHGSIAWSRWNDVASGFYYYLLVSLFPWYGIVGINKKFGLTRVTSLLEAALLVAFSWLFYRVLGLTGFILALILSKLLMGFLPSLLYLRETFGEALWSVFRGALIRPLSAAPLCVAAAWIPFLLHPGALDWKAMFLWVTLSSLLSLGSLFLFGVSRGVRSDLISSCFRMLGYK